MGRGFKSEIWELKIVVLTLTSLTLTELCIRLQSGISGTNLASGNSSPAYSPNPIRELRSRPAMQTLDGEETVEYGIAESCAEAPSAAV